MVTRNFQEGCGDDNLSLKARKTNVKYCRVDLMCCNPRCSLVELGILWLFSRSQM